jgi:hypothetical protein
VPVEAVDTTLAVEAELVFWLLMRLPLRPSA